MTFPAAESVDRGVSLRHIQNGIYDRGKSRTNRQEAEAIVTSLQRVRVDEEDETEELSSLSDAAEALRLTAAAPPRPTPSGGDYE